MAQSFKRRMVAQRCQRAKVGHVTVTPMAIVLQKTCSPFRTLLALLNTGGAMAALDDVDVKLPIIRKKYNFLYGKCISLYFCQ